MAAPKGLKSRGRALWKALDRRLDTTDGVLALEACRSADRLEELDSIIAGEGVLELMRLRLDLDDVLGDPRATVTVKFDGVLAEARQQQNNLRQMLVTLAASAPAEKSSVDAAPKAAASSAVDEFTARRRQRGAG